MNTVDKSGQRNFNGTGFRPDQLLWDELEREDPDAIRHRALVGYDREKGFLIPFLGKTFGILPGERDIVGLERCAPQLISFELELIILTYLLRAKPIALTGKTVTFDSTIWRHLPLDIIWSTVNVVSKWMISSA